MDMEGVESRFDDNFNLICDKIITIDDITVLQRVTIWDLAVSLEVAPASEC